MTLRGSSPARDTEPFARSFFPHPILRPQVIPSMNPSFPGLRIDSDVAANFWPHTHPVSRTASASRLHPSGVANLYELFVHELSVLVAGACQADRLARTLFAALAPDQVRVRRLVLGLAQSARGCLPALPSALVNEGLVLASMHDSVIDVLLNPIDPNRRGPMFSEPRGVVGARTVGVFTHVALHFKAEAAHAAEDARLLGSDALHHTLMEWAGMWTVYLRDLRRQEQSFRVQAYAAGLNTRPCWQSA